MVTSEQSRLEEHPDLAMRAAARLALVTRPTEVLNEIGLLVADTVGAQSLAIARPVSSAEAEMVVVTGPGAGFPGTRLMERHQRHPLIESLNDGQVRMYPDLDSLLNEFPDLESRAQASGDQAWAFVPLIREGSIAGAIGLGFKQPPRFTEFHENLYREFGHICLAATERARLYEAEATARQLAELAVERSAALVVAAISANQANTPRAVLRAVLDSARRIPGGTLALATYRPDLTVGPVEVLVGAGQPAPTPDQVDWVGQKLKDSTKVVIIDRGQTADVPHPWREAPAIVLMPITASNQRIGSLVAILQKPDVGNDDLELFEALASTASQGLARSRLFEREHTVAITLQQSLLALELPPIPGAQVAARYRPGWEGLEVGGDWFQVVPLRSGRVVLAVGDVVGRGLQAASAMGQIRSALAGAAISKPAPVQVLKALDKVVTQVPGGAYTTVAYCLFNPENRLLRYACAGHPPPLLIEGSGNPLFLMHGRGAPLAVLQSREKEGRRQMFPGDHVLLYSDGLIERRNESIDDGLRRLAKEATAAVSRGIEAGADQLLARLAESEESPSDDVTLLWMSVT
jgi:serine/threonine-protein kinase RsbW